MIQLQEAAMCRHELNGAALRQDVSDVVACPDCLGTLEIGTENTIRCLNCGTTVPTRKGVVYFAEPPSDCQVADVEYIRNPSGWSGWRRRNYDFYVRELSKFPEGSVLIDVGTGPGFIASLAKAHRYVGIDFYNYPDVEVVSNVVAKKLPIRNQCADVVILSNVLEHLSKPERLLAECMRILKPQGTVLITVPFMMKLHQAPYDYYRYSHYKLREMFEDAGLQVESIDKLGSIFDVQNSVKYEISQIALANARRHWFLNQLLRIDFHLNKLIRRLYVPDDEPRVRNGDFYTGYAAVIRKCPAEVNTPSERNAR